MQRLPLSCIVFLIAMWTAAALAQSDGLPRGCNEMPYVRYEAESGTNGGGAILRTAFDFDVTKTASEASNRSYVGLPTAGSFVQWTVAQQADGVTLRFTLPDNATGDGVSGSLQIAVNGTNSTTVNLSSYWAWTYFPTSDPVNTPGARPRMRFDEVHFRLPAKLQPGDVLRISKTTGDAYEYGIDFIEIEDVAAPLAKPAEFVSVADYGANGNDAVIDSAAFAAAWSAAKTAGTGLYIPPGKYLLDQKWNLGDSTNLSIQGAGIWFTELFFTQKANGAIGVNFGGATTGLNVSHFYMNSVLNERFIVPGQVAACKAFNGPMGSGSSIHHVWINHFEVGAWLADYSSPISVTTGLDFGYNRVRNTYADGINFTQGTSNCTARQCDFRDNGDDGIATWTSSAAGAPEGHDNIFHNNTVEFTYRAGGAAIFGGYGHQIHHCIIKDGLENSGIRFNEGFAGYHFENNNAGIRVFENTLIARGTSADFWGNPHGAIDIDGTGIRNVLFDYNTILDSPRHAILLDGGTDLHFTGTIVNGTGLDTFNSPPGAAVYEFGPNGSAEFVTLNTANVESVPAVVQTNAAYVLVVYVGQLAQSPYEMQIQLSGYDRTETLRDFPVLVRLGPQRGGFSYNQFSTPSGDDLRFRDAAGHELRYEIESWDPAGTSLVWVQVPALSAGTSIWAGWGSTTQTARPAYTSDGSVWSAGYSAVYHADEGSGTRRDSSLFALHGTPVGGVSGTAGMVGGADAFDGNGDAVSLPAGFGFFNGTQSVTVEFWFKASAVAPDGNYLISPILFQGRGENSWMVTFGDSMPGNTLGVRVDQGGWATPASAPGIQTQRWYHFTTTCSPTGTNNWKVFLDGALATQSTRTGAVAAQSAAGNKYGGSAEPSGSRWFNGAMDEVRVSSVARSADWVWASWKSVAAPETFATYGAVQEFGPRYVFTRLVGSGGSVSGSPSGSYVPGRTVTVQATPAQYYLWSNWSGNVSAGQSTPATLTLTMDADRTVTAVFAPVLAAQGVPHWWLAQYGWVSDFDAAAHGDADADGEPTWEEYYAGTVPTNAASVFTSRIEYLSATSQLRLTWSSVAGKRYRTERAPSPAGPWTIRTEHIAATPPTNTLTFPPPPGFTRAFYRVVVE